MNATGGGYDERSNRTDRNEDAAVTGHSGPSSMIDRIVAYARARRGYLAVGAVVLLVALGLSALHHLTRSVRFSDVRAAFYAIDPRQIMLSVGFTIASYIALTFYDVIALRVVGKPLRWRTAAMASFTSYTLSHNLGLALLTGGSARYRVYAAAGLDGPDIARVIAIASATFWFGVFTVTGFGLLFHDGPITVETLVLAQSLVRWIGGAVIAGALLLILLCALRPGQRIGWRAWSVPLPSPAQAVAQIGIASLELACASAALFVLLPGASIDLLPAFLLAYALAIIVALVSHVPGGIGVFEAVVLATVPVDRTDLFAALLAYRVLYYLAPLALGIALLAWDEARRRPIKALRDLRRVLLGIAPMVLSAACFGGGSILLLSGSLPAIPQRVHHLVHILPLPFIEASHFAASLVGTGLLLLAPGLYRRLDGASLAARALLVAGAVFSLAKGIDYEEAAVCLSIALLLQMSRRAFYRRTSLVARPLSPAWLFSVAVVIVGTGWLGFFAYKHVAYQESLWWRFALSDDASRFLRAGLGVAVMLAGAGLWRLFLAAPPGEADHPAMEQVLAIVQEAERTDAALALLGDKRFLFSPEGDAFVMYQVRGTSWIAMGDPVGPRAAWADLLWQLRTMADAGQGRLMLYQITPDCLEIAIEMGLQIIKYGEEALIDLSTFALEGGRMRGLRQTLNRFRTRENARFAILPAAEVPAIMPELKSVSDDWLLAKGHGEKGFSLGRFDPAYLALNDCAVVRVEGRIVAFANIWKAGDKRELSVDLMRHVEDAPGGVMDYLFVELMLWGQAEGYGRFALGLAPLSGVGGRRMAPTWAKVAALVFRHGERFYGFRGLRAYKEKFQPEWAPRYIAGPRGLGLVKALRDLNALIADGGEPV
uniref:bifunctional lysylphosphatidylglycerol flippase/synthetase MprF n=2 Tax=Sphingomonas fuzhouensis TaxID=3106033 RepID=UPI002AFE7C8B|nr:bifunctional lysylphosphatidylglycerol flippase/synthetase MprF [Sphingomonas sp. SGZ-02]